MLTLGQEGEQKFFKYAVGYRSLCSFSRKIISYSSLRPEWAVRTRAGFALTHPVSRSVWISRIYRCHTPWLKLYFMISLGNIITLTNRGSVPFCPDWSITIIHLFTIHVIRFHNLSSMTLNFVHLWAKEKLPSWQWECLSFLLCHGAGISCSTVGCRKASAVQLLLDPLQKFFG